MQKERVQKYKVGMRWWILSLELLHIKIVKVVRSRGAVIHRVRLQLVPQLRFRGSYGGIEVRGTVGDIASLVKLRHISGGDFVIKDGDMLHPASQVLRTIEDVTTQDKPVGIADAYIRVISTSDM